MRTSARFSLLIIAFIGLVACNKSPGLTAREEQEQNEIKEPLLSNEILEQEGLRFALSYAPANVTIALKLYEGTGQNLVEIPLDIEQPNVNFGIDASKLKENSNFTLVAEFKNVTTNGTFNLSVIGFTDINNNKNFIISGIPYTTANNQGSKAILRIGKGIHKFTFNQL